MEAFLYAIQKKENITIFVPNPQLNVFSVKVAFMAIVLCIKKRVIMF